MLIEIAAFLGVALLCLFFFAETKGKAILGVFGALILILLSIYLWTDGITVLDSQTRLTNETQIYSFLNETNQTNVTVFRNETIENAYADVAFYQDNKELVTLTLLGAGAFLLFHYAFNITKG